MSDSLTILAIETALETTQVALVTGQTVVTARQNNDPHEKTVQLVPMIEAVMAEADLAYPQLDRIAVTTGPGSFTGIRIGLATARGLALAANVPVVGVTTFDLYIRKAMEDSDLKENIAVLIDTKRRDFYAQHFTPDGEPQGAPYVCSLDGPEDIKYLISDVEDLAIDGYDVRVVQPDMLTLAQCAAEKPPGELPRPVYIRPPEAKLPTNIRMIMGDDA